MVQYHCIYFSSLFVSKFDFNARKSKYSHSKPFLKRKHILIFSDHRIFIFAFCNLNCCIFIVCSKCFEGKSKHAKYSFKILPFKSAMFKVSKAPNTKPLFGKHYVCSYDVVEEGRLQGSLRRHYSTLWCMFCYVCERGNEIQNVTN